MTYDLVMSGGPDGGDVCAVPPARVQGLCFRPNARQIAGALS